MIGTATLKQFDLVDFQANPGFWIHGKVLEISAQENSCKLMLYNNSRENRFVSLTSSDISPYHLHSLPTSLSDSKYLRFWPFSEEQFQKFAETLSRVLETDLMLLSPYDSLQFFGAQLPFLFAQCISRIATMPQALKVCEQILILVAMFLTRIGEMTDLLIETDGFFLLRDTKAAVACCWPEIVFILTHMLEDTPFVKKIPSSLFGVHISSYTNGDCSLLIAQLLEVFQLHSGFEALLHTFDLALPLSFYLSLPLLQLALCLSREFQAKYVSEIVPKLLVLVHASDYSEDGIKLLERTIQLAQLAKIDNCSALFQSFWSEETARSETEPERLIPMLQALIRFIDQMTKGERRVYLSILERMLSRDNQANLLLFGGESGRKLIESYLAAQIKTGSISAEHLELYASLPTSRPILNSALLLRVMMPLIKNQQWDHIARLFRTMTQSAATIISPLSQNNLIIECEKRHMPVPLLFSVFPSLPCGVHPRFMEQLLIHYDAGECADVLTRYYVTPNKLISVLGPKAWLKFTSTEENRRKLAYFLFTRPRLFFTWSSIRGTQLPMDLIRVASEYL